MQLEQRYLMHTYARLPVEFVRGDGCYLYDSDGTRYLDFLAGIGSVCLGHGNAVVTEAIAQQATRLMQVGNYFYTAGRGELAQRLSAFLNGEKPAPWTQGTAEERPLAGKKPLVENKPLAGKKPLVEEKSTTATESASVQDDWKLFFANSGAEANEGAIKLARKYGTHYRSGAFTIVSLKRSFHGRSLATTAATGQEVKQEAFAPMPAGFIHIQPGDVQALADLLQAGTSPAICAVMVECIQGEGGVWPLSPDYLRAVRELTAKRAVLLIIDEVQTGFCRSGLPFAFMHSAIRPDVVTLAKGIANGFPCGALAATGRAANVFEPGEHGSTFGGNPLAVAAAHATLDQLVERDLVAHVAEMGTYLSERLLALPHVSEVRGKGLMLGIGLSQPRAAEIAVRVLKRGLVLGAIGTDTLRLLPPLSVSRAQADAALDILESILETL
jgi:acetylornithine aminotransferase